MAPAFFNDHCRFLTCIVHAGVLMALFPFAWGCCSQCTAGDAEAQGLDDRVPFGW